MSSNFPRNQYLDKMLGLKHEPPTPEQRRRAAQQRRQLEQALAPGKPRPHRKVGAYVDRQLGIQAAKPTNLGAQESATLIHVVGDAPPEECCRDRLR